MISTSSLERVVHLHHLLKTGRRFRSQELAERLEVHTRTVMRAVETLRRFGAPIPEPPLPDGYYYTDTGFDLPSNMALDEGELFAFVIAQKVIQAMGPDSPHARTLQRSLKKLSRHLAGTLPIDPNELFGQGYSFDLGSLREVDPEVLSEVDRARTHQMPLDMSYRSLHDGLILKQRVVEPNLLQNYKGDWYLVAYCRLAGDLRTFAMSRIESCRALEQERFEPRPGYDPERHFQNSLGIFSTGDPGPCSVWFSSSAARWITERRWHPSQQLHTLQDGSVVLTLEVGPTLDVIRWILAHGPDARPLAPDSLVLEVQRQIQAALALHAQPIDLPPPAPS